MLRLRHLQHCTIALLCLWLLIFLEALSNFFQDLSLQTANFPYDVRQQQQLKAAIRKRHFGSAKWHGNSSDGTWMIDNNMSFPELDDGYNDTLDMLRFPKHQRHKKRKHHHGKDHRRKNKFPPLNGHIFNKTDSKPWPMTLPRPVIVVGFPKAGTSSVFSFFRGQKLGLKCQHWFCCANQVDAQSGGPALMSGCMLRNLVQNRSSIFDGCGNFDVFAEINGPRTIVGPKKPRKKSDDIPALLLDDGSLDFHTLHNGIDCNRIFFPQYFNLLDIHEAYPNATFVLNTRDFDSWIKSVQKWNRCLDWQFISEFYQRGELDRMPVDPNNKTERIDLLRIIYDKHHDQIRRFVKDFPSHAMVEVDILDPKAGEILGDAFGLDPSTWGKVNSNHGGITGHNINFFSSPTIQMMLFLETLIPDPDESPFLAMALVFVMTVTITLTLLLGAQYFYLRYGRRYLWRLRRMFSRRND